MAAKEWTVPEVELALLGLKKISVPEFEILASFEIPPNVVRIVLAAVQTLLGAEDISWETARSDLLQERPPPIGSTTASEEFSKLLANTSPYRKEYPKPSKPRKRATIVQKILEYTGAGKDPKKVTESIQKFMSHPEFNPDNAGQTSRATRALCVWVQAIEMNFQEQRKKPPRHQIEQAIMKGQRSVAGVYNLQVTKLLPQISKITGKPIASKEYDELQASKHYIMRRVFKDKHREARKAISSTNEEIGTAETYERDVDLRASNDAFRKRLTGRVHASDPLRELRKRAEPRLVSLCKFNDRAFQSEAAGMRSWERFHNIDPVSVSFEDSEPRPCTVERKVRRAEDLDRLYKSDVLIRQLLKALDSQSPDQDVIKKLVSAGANLDYVDDKSRTVQDIIREKKLFVSLHILDRIVQEKKGAALSETGGDRAKRRQQGVYLPPIELPRPRSFQQRHRAPLDVKTYRKFVAPTWQPKYLLSDPNEVLTDSDVEEEEEEDEIDPAERKRGNILRYSNVFQPPLTPPMVSFSTPASAHETAQTEREEVPPSRSNAEEEVTEEPVDCVAPADMDTVLESSVFLTDGGRLQSQTPEYSEDDAFPGENEDDDDDLDSALRTPSPALKAVGRSKRLSTTRLMLEEHERLQRDSVAKKKGLFDIYKGGTERGGLDDPSSSSSAHEYLRFCEQLGLLPRPLAFGRPNQRDLNLQGFGLHPRHAQALALSIRGLDSCTSLNLQENKLGEQGLAALSKALADNTTIVSLNLSFNQLGREGGGVVREWDHVEERGLHEEPASQGRFAQKQKGANAEESNEAARGSRMEGEAALCAAHIASLLTDNSTLKHLSLEGNEMPDKHLATVVASVSDPDVRDSLNVAGNNAGKHSVPLLVRLVEASRITSLNLCWMGLGKRFVETLAPVLGKNMHLKVLKLAWNGICDESVTMLARCFTEAASTGKMKLEVLDLAHNRIHARGAATLAMTMERCGAGLTLQSISLDGNAIGDVGFRACVASMAVCGVTWGLWNCSPEVRSSEHQQLFEADRLWRGYELDLADLYQHLVAWKIARLSLPSATTPEGATWEDAKVDGAAIEQPDPDWDPPETGVLKFSVRGPTRGLRCKSVFTGETVTVLDPLEDDSLPDALAGTVRLRKHTIDEEEEAPSAGEDAMRVVKFVKQAVFSAAHDKGRQEAEPDQGVHHFIADNLSPHIKPGAVLYTDRIQLEVLEAQEEGKRLSVRGVPESLQRELTEGRRHELELRHSFLLLAPAGTPTDDVDANTAEDADSDDESEDDGLRLCLYEARLPRMPVDAPHFERVLSVLSSLSRGVGEEGAVLCLRTVAKDLCFSIRQAEKIAETFLFVPAKRLLPLLLSPSDAAASLHKLNKTARTVVAVGKEFASVVRPWVDHETAEMLDEHLVHQQHQLEHRTDGEAFVDMSAFPLHAPFDAADVDCGRVGGKFRAVREGDVLPADPKAGLERSILFQMSDDEEWDEPMGALSKVVLILPNKRVELAVYDDDHLKRTLRLGEAPLSIHSSVELGEMSSTASFKLSTMTKDSQAYDFEYAEFGAFSPGNNLQALQSQGRSRQRTQKMQE